MLDKAEGPLHVLFAEEEVPFAHFLVLDYDLLHDLFVLRERQYALLAH